MFTYALQVKKWSHRRPSTLSSARLFVLSVCMYSVYIHTTAVLCSYLYARIYGGIYHTAVVYPYVWHDRTLDMYDGAEGGGVLCSSCLKVCVLLCVGVVCVGKKRGKT